MYACEPNEQNSEREQKRLYNNRQIPQSTKIQYNRIIFFPVLQIWNNFFCSFCWDLSSTICRIPSNKSRCQCDLHAYKTKKIIFFSSVYIQNVLKEYSKIHQQRFHRFSLLFWFIFSIFDEQKSCFKHAMCVRWRKGMWNAVFVVAKNHRH